jgi:SecD/SecF fusion protein
MPTNYSGRFTLIAVFILIALAAIFWPTVTHPSAAFDPGVPFSKKIGLRPGIDMVGGTSLLYEIKPAEGTVASEDLAQTMMASLKRRVDPDGTRNLVWRPQGATRLEIQMPAAGGSKEAEAKQAAFTAARDALEATNVRPADVIDAVEQRNGRTRAELAALAGGSSARAALFDQLAKAYDQIDAANKAKDSAARAAAELTYDSLKARIATTNVSLADVNTALSLKGADRAARLARLKSGEAAGAAAPPAGSPQATQPAASSFPARAAAIEAYAKARDEFEKVRGQLDDAADLKRDLRGAGVLEFHVLVHPTDALYGEMAERLQRQGPRAVAGDKAAWFPVDDPARYEGPTVKFNEVPYVLAFITDDKSLDNRPGKQKWGLERAEESQDQLGARVVSFGFDPQGAIYFGDLTRANVGEPMAILLDGRVLSAPRINEPITGGSGQISGGGKGGFSRAEAGYLIRTLRAGSLPARLADEPISERTVGPQLGADNLKRGLIACVFGLVVVAVFLTGYYYLAGVVATFAVFLNMLFILGMMAALPGATITLPGVAGIVLTIGMAVDANVLIFERLREEQVRGLSLRMAIRNAYDRAFSAILDGNVTTGITALILFWVGSEEVKGFGLTLLLGIVSSLFTALFVTRTIFGVLIDRFGVEKLGSLPLTFPRWDRMLRPNIDWMGKAWMFYAFSGVFIFVGLVAFGVKWRQGQMLDIEFTKGTSVQFELREPMPIDKVRELITAQGQKGNALPSPSVVSVGTDARTYEVVTPNEKAPEVREAVIAAIGDNLKIERPSHFAGDALDFDAALAGGRVVPVERADQPIAGLSFSPAKVAGHVGGAAILLKNLEPAISADDIEHRIERQRLSAQGGGGEATYHSFDVETNARDAKTPATEAVVFVSDPAFPYTPGDELKLTQWKGALAAPMWSLSAEALTKPAGLQRVSNFDAQVAGETARDALAALTLSIVVIMAYVWMRFGNLKYGTATVVALLHDTLFTLAAVGVAHYLANTFIGDALLLEPFRVNLTLVAAVLTVMGYSMNDTVVVFDRIRENRGKLGHVSRQLINDSINQTLSRTLLTGGTTILTIFVMYLLGGAGIHGFTFALLVGILVGTYSSIAIASPILLLGGGVGAEEGASNRPRAVGQLQRAGA